jgi:co-chaperonin GroES (HSP10)
MLKPIKNDVIVELIEKEKITAGGIILKNADPNEVNRARILKVSDKVTLVEVGQVILPNWNAARPVKYLEQDFYVVSEDDIVLIFED